MRWTVTALLEATDSWAFDTDRGKVNAVVFLDLKKAFDTVDHDVLLGKLSLYGILESAYDWFDSYLNNRTQKCVVNGSLSKVCSLGCGVPQGTILGPLLFLIYINDLPNCLSFCQPRMYADDTHITYASADLHSVQSSLNLASQQTFYGVRLSRIHFSPALGRNECVTNEPQRTSAYGLNKNQPPKKEASF